MERPISESVSNQRLAVRIRRTVAADGSESTEYSVFCPVRSRSVSLGDCKACELCAGTSVDPLEQNSFVLCTSEPREPIVWQAASLRAQLGDREAALPPVATIMTKNVLCVRPEVSIQELTLLLFECGVSGVPVVDPKGKALGVVSKTDLLRENYERAELEVEEAALHSRGRGSSSLPNGSGSPHTPKGTVAEIMTHTVLSLPEWASIQEAAALMALEGVRRIPIVDQDDRVVGIVCASDVLSWLAREAGYVIPSKLSPKWRTS